MLFESISWVMLTLTLLVALPGALASATPKRTRKSTSTRVTIETYPAMENGEIVAPRPDKIPALDPDALPPPSGKIAKNTKSSRRVQTLGAAAPVAAPLSAPAEYVVNNTVPATAPAPKFESVPSDKRGQILQRMRLCESLFEASGRAYDYRTMTTAELQRELEAVHSGERPIAAKNPEAAKSNAYAPAEPDPILDAQE